MLRRQWDVLRRQSIWLYVEATYGGVLMDVQYLMYQ